MKLVKFRIKNYKSITDSGDCYLTDNITIFAGKNESGKTSILEALEDFDTDTDIREEAKPINQKKAIPEICITFEIDKSSLKEIFNELEIDKKFSSSVILEITKSFPNEYQLSQKSKIDLGLTDKIKVKKLEKDVEKFLKEISKIHEKYPQLGGKVPELNFNNLENLKTSITQFKEQTTPNLNHISEDKEKEKFSSVLIKAIDNVSELNNLSGSEEKFIEEFKNWIPNFILFSSFEDVFPNKIPIAELDKNEWIKDLSIVSNLDISKLKEADDRGKHKHKKDVNIALNNDYKKFWTQDISDLSIDWDSEHLFFWIEEDGYPYEPSLRSKGRQWHLAFYIKVSARAQEDVPNIILIDEPGLFLHAQAQKDILKKLEASAQETQLIFATHSPYLLEADKLNRIRLIHRTKKIGTKIENKIHALADKETLTPILTAIGLELNAGIAHLDKEKNLVIEGPSDFYYLQAFKKIQKNNDLNFVYGGGSGNMPFVGTILHGWGCKVIYLYDNDQGKRDGEKNLKKHWLVSRDLILSVIAVEGSIEDIFNQDDFKKYVLNNPAITYKESNSEYVKNKKIDKVLTAKLFLESVEKKTPSFSRATLDNISELFKNINKKF